MGFTPLDVCACGRDKPVMVDIERYDIVIAGAGLTGAAFALAAAQAAWHYTLIRDRTREGCFVAFSQNHWLAATVFAGIALTFGIISA